MKELRRRHTQARVINDGGLAPGGVAMRVVRRRKGHGAGRPLRGGEGGRRRLLPGRFPRRWTPWPPGRRGSSSCTRRIGRSCHMWRRSPDRDRPEHMTADDSTARCGGRSPRGSWPRSCGSRVTSAWPGTSPRTRSWLPSRSGPSQASRRTRGAWLMAVGEAAGHQRVPPARREGHVPATARVAEGLSDDRSCAGFESRARQTTSRTTCCG